MGRKPCCEKVGMKKGKWTEEEDEILVKYIAENGEGSWRSLPRNAGLLRCGKSCRLRWVNYLRTGVRRGNISKEEEEIIIKLHASHGNRWSFIAKYLPGRTDNEIKNYWKCHLNRRLQTFTRNGEAITVDLGTVPGGKKRRNNQTNCAAIENSASNSTGSLKPPSTSCVEEHNKMFHSGINAGQSFVFDLDWVFPSPQAWGSPHVGCNVEDMDDMFLEDHTMEELSTFLWESSS